MLSSGVVSRVSKDRGEPISKHASDAWISVNTMGYLEKSQSQRFQIASRFVFCIFYPIQIDLVQDSSLSVGIFGIWRRLFGTCFNSFSPVPNDKLDFASTVWTQPLTSSCFSWFLLGSFHNPENLKTHVTMSQAAKPCNAMLNEASESSGNVSSCGISSTYPAEWMGWSLGQRLEVAYLVEI